MLATRLGVRAAHAAHDGRWGRMVALRGLDIVDVPLDAQATGIKTVPRELYEVAEVFFG